MRVFSRQAGAVRRLTGSLFVASAILLTALPATASDDPAVVADTTPTRVLSVVSGGYWETAVEEGEKAEEKAEGKAPARGYYRTIAVRSADNTSRLYLQRIRLSEDGPMLLDTREVEALSEMKVYITDMRPENSTGIASQPGFVTFVYLKNDPAAAEPDTWELYVDEFGDTAFTPATN